MSDGAPIRVGVNGARGRMGIATCAAIHADPALQLVAAVHPSHAGESIGDVVIDDHLRAFAEAGCDVVVDFTVADAARNTVPWLAMHGIHGVIGTSGFTDDDFDAFRAAFGEGPANCIIASNFAISAVLMARFAEIAAPFFDTAEIIELHHDAKVDAPSGTAIATAERMAAVSSDWAPDPTQREVIGGARGAAGPGGIRVHSVRMRGMVGHQEVLLGTLGQTLSIRQDSYDRTSYMPGVVLACKHVAHHRGLSVGLDRYLGI